MDVARNVFYVEIQGMGNVVLVVPAQDRGLTHSLAGMLSVEKKIKRRTQLANLKPGSTRLCLRAWACTRVLLPG